MQVKHADVAGCGLMAAEATGFFKIQYMQQRKQGERGNRVPCLCA